MRKMLAIQTRDAKDETWINSAYFSLGASRRLLTDACNIMRRGARFVRVMEVTVNW